jgi:PTH1 family peptidyl-tRNA hydrolase
MKIILGLGNPGDRYAYTYHNMGFLAVECLADKLKVNFKTRECDSITAKAFIGGETVVIAKPLTFMNLSGKAAKQLFKKYKATHKDLIVIYDDIDIEKGNLRIREKGSAGTHNGMRSIIAEIGTQDFFRIRIGVGRPPENFDLANYVLSEVPKSEREMFFGLLDKAAEEALKIVISDKL